MASAFRKKKLPFKEKNDFNNSTMGLHPKTKKVFQPFIFKLELLVLCCDGRFYPKTINFEGDGALIVIYQGKKSKHHQLNRSKGMMLCKFVHHFYKQFHDFMRAVKGAQKN